MRRYDDGGVDPTPQSGSSMAAERKEGEIDRADGEGDEEQRWGSEKMSDGTPAKGEGGARV